MVLIDVNVLIYAHQTQAPDHSLYRDWLLNLVESDSAYGMSDLVLNGFIRITTNPRAFSPPTQPKAALAFANLLRIQPNCVQVNPGPRHWGIFTRLCEGIGAKANIVPDAYLAAMAIEGGSEWITTDSGFGRFPGLRWRHPLG